jgi:hypothetical protein
MALNLTLSPSQAEFFGAVLGLLFTVALLSYLLGDNPLYRLALHTFIGVAIGYAALVVLYQVLVPRLIAPLASSDPMVVGLASVPLVLFIFLIFKLSPRTAVLGNISIAYLIGVGAAVSAGGALTGTLLPQIRGAWVSLLPGSLGVLFSNLIILVGTVTTLIYFQYWLRGRTPAGEPRHIAMTRVLINIGKGFLTLTLGVIYGGMILSGIAIFSERLSTLSDWINIVMR